MMSNKNLFGDINNLLDKDQVVKYLGSDLDTNNSEQSFHGKNKKPILNKENWSPSRKPEFEMEAEEEAKVAESLNISVEEMDMPLDLPRALKHLHKALDTSNKNVLKLKSSLEYVLQREEDAKTSHTKDLEANKSWFKNQLISY